MTEQNNGALSVKDQLNLETAKISWKELELFFAKGNLINVATSCDLVKVAEKIVDNQKVEVEKLILDKKIEFITGEWVTQNCSNNPNLWAVVVAPYVLCQLTNLKN